MADETLAQSKDNGFQIAVGFILLVIWIGVSTILVFRETQRQSAKIQAACEQRIAP